MGIISALSGKFIKSNKRHKKEKLDSHIYQNLDCFFSAKTKAEYSYNVNDLVDYILAKKKVSSLEDKAEDYNGSQFLNNASSSKKLTVQSNGFTYSKNTLKKKNLPVSSQVSDKKRFLMNIEVKKTSSLIKLPVKKVLSILLSVLLIFAAITSASILSSQGGSSIDVLSISLSPENIYNNDTMFVNVAIPDVYFVTSVSADMAGVEIIDLLLVDNTTSLHLWHGVWFVYDVMPGEHIVTITGLDVNNTPYSAGVRWSVLPEEIPDENQSSETGTNETSAGENEIIISTGLNLTLQSDKLVHVINETVLISGVVSFNNSLINTSAGLLIAGSDINLSVGLNVADGLFEYRFVPIVAGSYVVNVTVIYLNETVEEELMFDVLDVPLGNVSLNVSDLFVWDDTDNVSKYVGDMITFYANYSSFNQSIENATCLISFNVGTWTEPKRMNYSNGYYVYRRSFDVSGTYEFKVWCAAPGYENKSAISQFFIYGNESTVSIVDPKEEHIDVVPGTRFYVERTVDGLHGTDVIFAPLFSDALVCEKIELLYDSGDDEKRVVKTTGYDVSLNYWVYRAGRPVSHIEKNIDMQRKKLPSELRELDQVAYSQSFTLQSPCTLRIWFKAPSWEEIDCGCKPSSGRISYLVSPDDGSDVFDFEGSTWWSSDWGYRKLITVNSSQVDADLINFPVLVYNSSDSDLASHAQNDGDDIAFVLYSDNSTQLNHEIELFNSTNGELVAWVNVTSLSSSSDTKIWMYYGNSTCSSQENITGVWDSNHVLVQHLNETSGTHYDATANNNDGTPYGGLNQNATGKVNGADVLDGTDDAVVAPDAASLDITDTVTIEAWIYSTDFKNQYSGIVTKWDWNSTNPQRSYSLYLMDWTKPCIMISADGTYLDELISAIQLATNTWYYLVGVSTGSKWILYINGAWDSEKAIVTTIHSGTAKLSIGSSMDNGSISTDEIFKGTIDEVRISNTARNSSWINTSYNTINNPGTFLNFSSEQQNTAPTITGELPSNGSTDISPTPTLNVTVDDADDDTLTAYWYSNSSGSWTLFATNSSIDTSSGSVNIIQTNSNFSNYSIMYYWSVNLTDGTNWCNETYHFMTEAINTSVDTITPYNVTSSPLTINATGDSSLDNVTLWYRYSTDNLTWGGGSNWSIWSDANNPDTSSPWSWNFDFPNDTGYYEFYSIGKKSGSSDETPPSSADARCKKINNKPTHTTPILNSTYGTNSTNENLTCYNQSTSDPDGDPIKNIFNWYKNSSSIMLLNMPFEGGSSSTYTKDYSGQGHDGTVSGATWNKTMGYDGKGAYQFDGIDDYIHGIPNSTINRNEGSIEVWAKPDSFATPQLLVWAGGSSENGYSDSDGQEFHLSIQHFNTSFGLKGFTFFYGDHEDGLPSLVPDANYTWLFSGNLTPNIWYHVVVTWDFDNNITKMYVNGTLVDSDDLTSDDLPYNTSTWQDEMHIGRPGAAQRYYNGTLDEVRIYDFALSPEQVLALSQNKTNTIVSQETSVNDVWQCEVTPNDGYQDGITLQSNSLTVIDISVNVTPSQWNQGTVWIGSSNATTGYYFNLTNEGNIALNILVKSSNATNSTTGFQWNLTATPGFNNFSLQYNKSGGGSWTNINTTYDTFVTNLSISSWQTFDLNLIMATTSSTVDPLSFVVTFKSVVS